MAYRGLSFDRTMHESMGNGLLIEHVIWIPRRTSKSRNGEYSVVGNRGFRRVHSAWLFRSAFQCVDSSIVWPLPFPAIPSCNR